ncbi:hypothetical protein [Spirillospora sp. NPDC047279]|uniref:hypothetical protein n=1 Tax=Spirillospora sp. NPDC047279 TaxID=3155478 RepID=UPI0033D74CCD
MFLLLGRCSYVDNLLALLPEDVEAIADFTAVDVMAPLMAELPEDVTLERAERLLAESRSRNKARWNHETISMISRSLPGRDGEAMARVSSSLIQAAACRVALDRLVRRFSPLEEECAQRHGLGHGT